MTIEIDNTQPVATNPNDNESNSDTESAEAVETKPEEKPDEATELQKQQAELVQERARISEERRKLDTQIAVLTRQRKTEEKERADLLALKQEVDGLVTFDSVSQHIAKRRGITVDALHAEWAKELGNGGKPPADIEQARRLEALEKQLEAERKEREAREERERESATRAQREQWGNEVESLLGFSETGAKPEATAKWPKLTSLPQQIANSYIINTARDYLSQTGGQLPNQVELLDWIEQNLPETLKPATAPSGGSEEKKKSLSRSRDAKGAPGVRPTTDEERRDAAIALFNSLSE